jgi:hypothetical protein
VRRSRSQWEEARLPRVGDEVISRQSSTPVLLLIDSTCWQNVLTNVLSKTIIKKSPPDYYILYIMWWSIN